MSTRVYAAPYLDNPKRSLRGAVEVIVTPELRHALAGLHGGRRFLWCADGDEPCVEIFRTADLPALFGPSYVHSTSLQPVIIRGDGLACFFTRRSIPVRQRTVIAGRMKRTYNHKETP